MSALRIDRKVEVRDVGRGEESGFARVPEFIDRLNALSPALFWNLEGRELRFEEMPGLTPNNFETQMMALVNQDAVLPMRMTNRHGLLGDSDYGFHDHVDGDAFTSGYVDIDDLLAGDDLGFQMLLVHFLTERAATSNYARRIGTTSATPSSITATPSGSRPRPRSCAPSSATRASASSPTRRASRSAVSSATAAGTGSAAASGSAGGATRRGSTRPRSTS